MSNEEEIIELNEDGVFEIPSESIKQKEIDTIDYENFDWKSLDKNEDSKLAFNNLKVNEFIHYSDSNSKKHKIILRISSVLKKIYAADNFFQLEFEDNNSFQLPFPSYIKINKDSITCKQHDEYVLVEFNKEEEK